MPRSPRIFAKETLQWTRVVALEGGALLSFSHHLDRTSYSSVVCPRYPRVGHVVLLAAMTVG